MRILWHLNNIKECKNVNSELYFLDILEDLRWKSFLDHQPPNKIELQDEVFI